MVRFRGCCRERFHFFFPSFILLVVLLLPGCVQTENEKKTAYVNDPELSQTPVATSNKSSEITAESMVFSGIDVQTGLPFEFNSTGQKKIVSKKWLYESCGTSEKIENLKKKISSGDQNAKVLLLAAAWFVLSPDKASEVVQLTHGELSTNNPLVNCYLGLFHKEGYGTDVNAGAAVRFFEDSYKRGCLAAGAYYFDMLPSVVLKGAEYQNWLILAKNNMEEGEYLARIGWAEYNGWGMKKDEQAGRVKMMNAAIKGSKFSNFQLGWLARERSNFGEALRWSKSGVSDVLANSYIAHGDLLVQARDLEQSILSFYREARKMNRNGLIRLADYFQAKGNNDEYLKILGLIKADLLQERHHYGVDSAELRERISKWDARLEGTRSLKIKVPMRVLLEQVKEMIYGHYYLNAELEEKFKQEFLTIEKSQFNIYQ